MNLSTLLRNGFFFLFLSTIAAAADTSPSAYKQGTITPNASSTHKSYNLKTGSEGFQISNCGEFQPGQVVDYRVNDNKVYIRREDGKEYKCSIEAKLMPTVGTPSIAGGARYQKGVIQGYEALYRMSKGGIGGVRRTKVYQLQGPNLIYLVDFCGAFQAGEFKAGQEVEFRTDGERVYIVHDVNKEFSCQLEGTQKPDSANSASEASSAAGLPAPAPTNPPSAPSTAKLSITSAPDGADIEVDGNFSGNTPSDLALPEGEHSISVKKSGYKAWERKMKVTAGSSLHLNAELEKLTP